MGRVAVTHGFGLEEQNRETSTNTSQQHETSHPPEIFTEFQRMFSGEIPTIFSIFILAFSKIFIISLYNTTDG